MSIKILEKYIKNCKRTGVEPSFQGLKRFNNDIKKLLAS